MAIYQNILMSNANNKDIWGHGNPPKIMTLFFLYCLETEGGQFSLAFKKGTEGGQDREMILRR